MPHPQTEVSVFLAGEQIYHRLLPTGEYIIGSADDADIRFSSDQLAPRHARLVIGPRGDTIEDLGSSSGSFLNGERLRTVCEVPESQRIEIGGGSISLHRLSNEPPALGDSATCGPTVSLVQVSAETASPSEAQSEPLAFPPQKYNIGGLVAAGGMGAILNVYETATRRHVAMKIMAERARPDPRRFLFEARITAQLEHPNIVPLHELAINQEGRPFYTMKLVQGVSLHQAFKLLGQRGRDAVQSYFLDAFLTIFQKICDAVAFAHSKRILHRDLKPDNIMLGQYGEVLVMDWGLAKLIGEPDLPPADDAQPAAPPADSNASSTKTLAGQVLGTPSYMSPEQARGEIERLDVRTDIYSLGAILYHYLTLEPPVTGKTTPEAVANACAGQIVPPIERLGRKKLSHLPSGRIPESLGAVAMKALAHDPANRYASVAELQREIRAFQAGFATNAEQAGLWRLFKLFFIRHRVVASSLTFVLIFGTIFLGYMIYEKHEADTQRDTAEMRLYLSHMALVRDDIDNGRAESAHELLDLHHPKPKENDLRDWEWYEALGELNGDNLRVVRAHRNGAFTITASPDGSLLASGGADGDIAIWKTQGLASELRFHAHDDAIFAVAWSRSGNLLASGGGKGMVRVWDAKTGRKLAEVQSPNGQPVHSLSWNSAHPDDPLLAFGGSLFGVYLWRPLAAGDEAKPKLLHESTQGVSSLTWSPNGAYLAFSEADSASGVEVIDLDGKSVSAKSKIDVTGSDISAVAIDPTNRYVAVGSRHRNVSVIDIPTGGIVFSHFLHTGMINALAWSPDGKQLASVGDDRAVRIVSPFAASTPNASPPAARMLSVYPRALNAVVWLDLPAKDEKAPAVPVLAAVDADGVLREWATNDGDAQLVHKVTRGAISSARWSPDGKSIAVGAFPDNIVDVTNDAGTDTIPLDAPVLGVYDCQWSPKGDRLALANREWHGCVEVLDVATGKCLNLFTLNHANRVTWDPTGNFLAAASIHILGDKIPAKVCLWNLSTDQEVASVQTSATSLAWSRDGRRLYLGGEDGSIQVWDGASHELGKVLRPAPLAPIGALRSNYEAPLQVFDLAVSPDEKQLAFVTQDGEAGVIDIQSAKPVCSFAGAASALRRVAWCSDGRRVGTCNSNGMLRIYDAKEGTLVAHFTQVNAGKNPEVEGLDWRPDGRRILTAGWNGQIHIWDADRGMEIAAGEDSAKQELTPTTGYANLLSLARHYTHLGWADLARQAYSLVAKANPRSPDLANEIAAAEKTFESSLTPSAVETRSPEQLLGAVHADWRSHDEQSFQWDRFNGERKEKEQDRLKGLVQDRQQAVDDYRQLSAIPAAAHLLPLAQRYFSACDWVLKWFPSTVDPVANAEGWRALAATPAAVAVNPYTFPLAFPYHRRSPREIGFHRELTASALPVDHWGMIATAKVILPAGKWRLQIEADGGVRALVDDKVLIGDAWKADAAGVHSGEYVQEKTGDVKITLEHFVTKPCQSFEFLLIPVP